ncbi:hypothetical protein INT44_003706 [Umbelopsis vinacea]|uniref:Methyltransferase domain-containing protein n=1 Tax=Umbelopsis vinacea TaxID=44442 RepID=A0A8H7UIX2_9FUNG|nr:hypothetical protein INT44_003706 [Umbelopsis vinacea]
MGTFCSKLELPPLSPKSHERHPLSNDDKSARFNNEKQVTTLVKIPPMANWPTSTIATDLDTSRRSSMRTEDDFMDGASIRKMSNASASSGSTQVEEHFHYHRLSLQQDKEYFPVEMTTGGDMLESTILSDFSWMQRPSNTFPVPSGKQQTNKENVIHYIMRYVMNGFHTAPLQPRSSGVGKILDIGSGSGIWAIEMANAYPRCEVVGIDLLCPGIGHDNIPENCSFKTVDVLAGLPFKNESFDYVFVRNMALELSENGYRSLINDSYRILKPGGYLEIVEPDVELKNSGPVTRRFLNLYAKAFECIGINAQLANCLPSLINTSWFATQASSACTWTVAIPVGKRWKSRIARLLALYLLSEFRSCKNMVCSVAELSEEDYDDVMLAVKQELLSVVDTHIIWRTVLAHKEDSTANCGRGFHMNPRTVLDK